MTDEPTDSVGTTRRGMLALAGTGAAALAGCGSLPLVGSDDTVRLDAAALADVASGEVPAVVEPLPVDVTDAYLAASRDRATALLEAVPLPLSADELPNGVMRNELAHSVEHARQALREAEEATGTVERLDRLRYAREHARAVAAAWAYAEDELTREDVRETAATVYANVREFREDWEYVGDDPVRALLVHDEVETWIETAQREAGDEDERAPTNAVTVGEFAGTVEFGLAHLDDARHVGERFTASLEDPTSLQGTFVDARQSLTETLAARRADIPSRDVDDPNELVDVDRDIEDTPAGIALDDLHRSAARTFDPTENLADDVLVRYRRLALTGAFESLRERVADGERFTVASVADVREHREAAVSAIEGALAESPDRRLARELLADQVGVLAYADRDIGRYGDTVPADLLEGELSYYVSVTAIAGAVPDACEATVDALGDA